jgi:hypothetical protein
LNGGVGENFFQKVLPNKGIRETFFSKKVFPSGEGTFFKKFSPNKG